MSEDKEKWLLSPEQISNALNDLGPNANYGKGLRAIAQAQLAHCEPLIRADERAKVLQAMTAECVTPDEAREATDRLRAEGVTEGRKQVVDWRMEPCPHRSTNAKVFKPRSSCEKCWQALEGK